MAGSILAINTGSSSVKIAAYELGRGGPTPRLHGHLDGIGTPHSTASAKDAAGHTLFDETWSDGQGPGDHAAAMQFFVERLTRGRPDWTPHAIGHRIVHGGPDFSAPVRIDDRVRAALEALIPLAPLHAPANLKGIDAAAAAFPGVPQIACFDTAFHAGRAFVSEAYALPREFRERGIRRYGFHGLSYEYIARAMRTIAPAVARGRMIVCHLGNGVSLTAIRDGKSVETTMGFTAVDGLPMGTRCGQLDPGVLLYGLQELKMTPDQLSDLIWKKSGLLGLSGLGSDMRDLLASDDVLAREAVDYFVYRLTYYVGALTACLGGLDGLVFTAGIGENAAPIRDRVCRALGWLGVELDAEANDAHQTRITTADSKVAGFVVPTDEDRMIAIHVGEVLGLTADG